MFSYDQSARALTLNHTLLNARWRWDDSGTVAFDQLLHIPSGKSWLAETQDDPMFLLGVDGVGQQFHPFDAHRELFLGTINDVTVDQPRPRGCIGATITTRLSQTPIEITINLEVHPDHAVIRQWFDIVNIGSDVQTITRLPVLLTNLAGTSNGLTAHSGLDRRHRFRKEEGADWFTWNTLPLRPGVAETIRTGHRKAATWLGLTSEGGPGLFHGWEANTATICAYGDIHGTGSCSIETWLEPEYILQPGQSLSSPAAFLGAIDGDLDELSYRTQRFAEDVIARPVHDDRFPYVAFNSWGYGPKIDDASMRQCFEICKKLGIELFVVDFGWEDADWHPRKDAFPNGLAPLAEAAHETGMQFGIHLSFGNVSTLSTMYENHPEWANGLGQWAYLDEGTVFRLTLGNPAARDWMIDKIVSIIDETGIDYFLTDHFLWGPTNPDVQHRHATDDYLTIAEGFDTILERVQELRPKVMMEHCDNGLAFPTFKMVSQHVTSIGPDAVGSQYERVFAYRISHVLPPRYLDHYVCERLAPQTSFDAPFGDYEYRSQIFGGPMILMTDIMALEEGGSDWNALQRTIDLFKRVRRNVADGKVLHLLEPQPVERVNDGWDGWDAIGSYHEKTDSAVIFVFRLGGDLDQRTIPIHGINPDSTYRISFEDHGDTFERTGADLMGDGLLLELPGPGQARMVDGLGFVRASQVIHLTVIAERTS